MAAKSRTYGHIPGVPVGTTWTSRKECGKSGVHSPIQAGIHGDSHDNHGAFSICLSGGYEDNVDSGETIIYVGAGGQDPNEGTQIADQTFDTGPNKALLISHETKRPVRVVRGADENNYYAPAKGYRYDGLYIVQEAALTHGKKGYMMCRFKLERLQEDGLKPIPTKRTLTTDKMKRMLRRAR
ncbi:SRA-YDG [Hygrophoropsis aurantiaca]|uniref:SRA-YDG n=1 Tax=Hygrophoropsis aurantiaca TaxID=72124 RepID=A0ACB8AFN4_9AGAM|nr:SRA-YDG [Hygrophoropsis aurantiaca]